MRGGDGYLVGFSTGGAGPDPGNRDLSATLPATFAIKFPELFPLTLTASNAPSLGATVSLLTTNIPTAVPFGAVLLGILGFDPGIDLTSIGMPDCRRYADPIATLLFLAPAPSVSVPLNIPNNQTFLGTNLFAQSAAYVVGANPLNCTVSNGTQLLIGPWS